MINSIPLFEVSHNYLQKNLNYCLIRCCYFFIHQDCYTNWFVIPAIFHYIKILPRNQKHSYSITFTKACFIDSLIHKVQELQTFMAILIAFSVNRMVVQYFLVYQLKSTRSVVFIVPVYLTHYYLTRTNFLLNYSIFQFIIAMLVFHYLMHLSNHFSCFYLLNS